MKKKSISLWHRCVWTAICLFTLTFPSGASTPWDGSTVKQPVNWHEGNTTLYISDATELAWLAQTVNNQQQTGATPAEIGFKGCTVVLTDNIDLNQKPWTPIGTTTPFAGSLDGQGYTISNLFIKKKDENAGLFDQIESQPDAKAFIRNLRVEGIVISNIGSGLLAASITGTDLLNINVEGTISNTEAKNLGVGLLAGGVTECDILNCVAVGELSSLSLGGGLVGTANIKASSPTRIQNCGVYITQSSASPTTGGLFCIGETSPTAPLYLKNNYVVAVNLSLPPILSITDENFSPVDLKQFPVGVYTNPDYLNLGGSLLNTQSNVGCCMWEETIFSSKKVPCLNFTRLAELSPDCWACQAITAGIAPDGSDIETGNSPNPTHFKVKTAAGLAWIAFICNGGNMNNDVVPADLSFENCTVELSDGLDLQKQEWTPIGNIYPFNGIFEGNGKTIKNLSILKIGENNGLFSLAGKQSDIRNLTLEGATLTGTVDVNNPIGGSIQAGAIAGASSGQINNCHTEGGQIRITFKKSPSSLYIGGLVGSGKNCKIADCSNANHIEIKDPNYTCQLLIGGIGALLYTQTLNCYNTGSLNMEGQGILGGIAGMAMALENCYNSGKINADVSEAYTDQPTLAVGGIAGAGVGYIANCYSTGDITAEGNLKQKDAPIAAGGICGMVQPFERDYYGYIDNCFATGSVRSAAYAGGIAGVSLMETAPSVKINHCLALNLSVTGDEKKTARITPYIDPSSTGGTYVLATIDGCYAYAGMLLNGSLLSVDDNKKPDAIHGADWTTYFADAPMKDWTAGAWNYTPPLTRATRATGLMPLLNQIKPETYQYNSAQTSSTKEFRNLLIAGQTAVPIPYTLTIAASTHGSVAIENGSLTGFVGREILLTVQPDNGYEPDRLSYTTKDTPTPVAITQNSNGKYSFTMPAGNVTIASTFRTTDSDKPDVPDASYTVSLPVVEGAFTDPKAGEYTVREGEAFSFSLTLEEGYDQSIPQVTTDRGETLLPNTFSHLYTVQDIRQAVTIRIEGIEKNQVPTANAEVKTDQVKIYTTGSGIEIFTPVETDAALYTLAGEWIQSLRLPAGDSRIPLARGQYIVRIGKQAFKIIL